MGMFSDILKSDETLFSNEMALDYDFVPRLLPCREKQQQEVARSIVPLLQNRNGKNLFVHGAPGIGKTAAIKWVFRDLEDETDEVYPVYVNCWQKNTSYKAISEMCEQLGYKFTQNKKTDELFKVVKNIVNKKQAVFAFDEVDKLEDFDFLYMIIEEILKKSVILITNYKEWLIHLDERIKSRLSSDVIEFEKYKPNEIEAILKDRLKYAFYEGAWTDSAFDLIVDKTSELEDVRQGIYLLREAGRAAEDASSRKIKEEHAQQAITKLEEFSVKSEEDLEEDSRLIIRIVRENSEKRIGELYKIYREKNGQFTTKTFQRKIEKLEKAGFLSTKKTGGGPEGNTTIVSIKNSTLNDF